MEDVVLIKISDRKRGDVFALTWGRVFDAVDPAPLAEAIKKNVSGFGLNDVTSVEVCESLSRGAREMYFYEGLLSFSQEMPPTGREAYLKWTKRMRGRINAGKEIFLISKRSK